MAHKKGVGSSDNGRDSNIFAPDFVAIPATNGVVHVIDTVILPEL